MKWDRLPPVEPCDSPDGHDYWDIMTPASRIPILVVCSRCNRPWTVVTYAEDQDAR